MPNLASMIGGPITTVAPSTTAAALTSISLGKAPSQHGITGYKMRIPEGILNVIRWKIVDSRKPAPTPRKLQPLAAFDGRDVKVITKRSFAKTSFTEVILGDVQVDGYSSASSIPMLARRASDERRLVYAYYDNLDTTGHERGLNDGLFDAELSFIDYLVGKLVAVLPSDVCLLVTSDHGHVHLSERYDLAPLTEMIALVGGDGRFRELHAKPGAAADLEQAARSAFGSVAWVMTRDELFDDEWLGPKGPDAFRRRVGDVVLAVHTDGMFVDPSSPGEAKALSGHGSLTADEMLVPLLATRGTG